MKISTDPSLQIYYDAPCSLSSLTFSFSTCKTWAHRVKSLHKFATRRTQQLERVLTGMKNTTKEKKRKKIRTKPTPVTAERPDLSVATKPRLATKPTLYDPLISFSVDLTRCLPVCPVTHSGLTGPGVPAARLAAKRKNHVAVHCCRSAPVQGEVGERQV